MSHPRQKDPGEAGDTIDSQESDDAFEGHELKLEQRFARLEAHLRRDLGRLVQVLCRRCLLRLMLTQSF